MHRGGRGRAPQRVTNQAARDRFLGENLGGAVFGATWETLNECTTGLVFGLPNSNWNWVQHVKEGMPIFLFNYTDKMMHGIFRAVTPGTLNINPYGWTRISNTPHTRYPAQVQVELFANCQPIVDRDFKSAIQGAFFTDKQFNYQLTAEEARRLCTMFSRSAARRLFEKKPAAAAAAAAAVTAAVHASGKDSPAPPGPSSPTQRSPGGHPSSRRPTPSSSTGSSELRHARSWEDTATAATTATTATTATAATATTTASALNQPDRGTKVEDTSTSRGEQADPSQQMSHQMRHAGPTAEAAAANGGSKGPRKPPPGFDDPQSAVAKPMRDRLQVKYKAWQPTAVGNSAAPDTTAAGSSPQLQPQGLPAKPKPAGRPHRYRHDEAEVRPAAEETEEEDQGAKRSRVGRSPHHPHTLATPSPPESTAEEEVQAPHRDNVGRPTGQLQSRPIPLVSQQQSPQQQQQQPQQAQQQAQQAQQQSQQQPQQVQQQAQQQAQQARQQPQQAEQSGLEEGDVHMMGTTPTGSSAMDGLAALTASHCASTQQASKIYLLGGGTESQDSMWLSTVDVYSPMTHSCQPATPLPTESAYGSAVAMENQLFYIGGGNGVDWFQSVLRLSLDDADGDWEQMADMHVGRGSLCTANLNSMVWAVGGRDSHTFHNSTECFHPALNVWTMGPSTLTKRFAAAGGVLGGAFYVTGGFDASTYTATAERLDPREKKWSQIPDMLSSRGSHACAVFDDKLYAIGGYAALKPLRDVEVFDPRTNRWQAIAQMNDTRAYFAGVACQRSLYAIGGLSPERGTPNYNHTLEKYDPMHDSWQVMQPAANALSARAFMSACVV